MSAHDVNLPATQIQGPSTVAVRGAAPIGPTLQRLWVWHRLNPTSPAYNVVRVVHVDGQIHAETLRSALRDLSERHEALRCAFAEPAPGHPEVVVGEPVPVPLFETVLPADRPTRQEVDAALRHITDQPFVMTEPPLWRVGLVRGTAHDSTWLVLVMHHLISDLRVTDVLLREMAELYLAYDERREPLPSSPAPSLLSHLRHESSRVGTARWDEDLGWWKDHLAGAASPPPLPLSTPALAGSEAHDGDARTIELSSAESRAVTGALRALRSTAAAFFMSASVAVLEAWTGDGAPQAIGIPSMRQSRAADEELVGFLLDTLVLRLRPSDADSFAALCKQVRDRFIDAAEHSLPPFDEIVRCADLPRLGDRAPLIKAWFNDLTTARCPAEVGSAPAREWDLAPSWALFDLNLYLWQLEDGRFRLHLVTPCGSLDPADGDAFLEQIRAATVRAAADPELPVAGVLASPTPRMVARPSSLLHGTRGALPDPVADWARRTPTRPALVDVDGTLDYRGLDAAVDAIAATLAVARGVRISLPARRDRTFVLRLLGCWRAGAEPVIIDAEWPELRREAALTASAAVWMFPWFGVGAIEPTGRRPDHDPDMGSAGHVLFTSGTTGDPLAVAVPGNVLNHELTALAERFDIGPGDRVSFLSGPAHDVAMRDVVLPLRAGATVCVPPPDVAKDVTRAAGWLAEQRVTVVNATPALLWLVLGLGSVSLPDLRLVVCGGAPLSVAVVELVRSRAPGATVANGYGCTETPQLATIEVVTPGQPLHRAGLTIGQPFGDRRVELRSDGRPTDVGVPGELWVAAPGIAAGYLTRDAPKRFVVDADGLRWFRTGDVARRDAYGRLHLAGRVDRQVLVNGHRVSLDELEAIARAVAGVGQALAEVVSGAGPSAGDTLRLWAEPVPGNALTEGDLRDELRKRLPSAVVPSRVMLVDRLPTTSNHKVVAPVHVPDLPAAGTVNEQIRAVAASVCGAAVDPDTNFFAAGFTSVMLLQLTAELEQLLGRPVPVVAPFWHPTLRALAQHLAADGASSIRASTQASPERRRQAVRPFARTGTGAVRAARRAARRGLQDARSDQPENGAAADEGQTP